MAATITSIGSGTSGSTPVATGATVTVVSGDWLVAVIAFATNRTATVTDPGGNTWIERAAINYDGAATGGYLRILTSAVTSGFTNGVVSCAIGGGGSAQNCIQVYRVRPSSGTISFVAADTTGSGSTTTSHSAATVSVAAGNTIFGCAAVETNDAITGDSDTANGSWSSVVTILQSDGSDDLSQSSVSQYKTVSLTGNQSWACTTTSARESARSYLVIKAESAVFSLAAAQGSYALSGTAATMRVGLPPMVAGAGSYALTGTAATLILPHKIDAAAGAYALTGTDPATKHAWKVTADVDSYALTGTAATPILSSTKRVQPDIGSYALIGTDAAPLHLGANIVADTGSYALVGTTATLAHGYRITAGDVVLPSSGDLLLETSDFLLLETGDRLVLDDSATITGGVYTLTGSNVALNASVGNKTLLADVAGSYALTGTPASLLHGWRVEAGDVSSSTTGDLLLETGDLLLVEDVGSTIVGGAYLLTGVDATLTPSVVAHLTLVAETGSYLLTGTAVTLISSAQPTVSPLHIGEWPIDKRKRRQREQADAKAIAARARFRRAIARLLEGLPPEFDEPEALDAALDNAVQAANLLYAMSAPIREINEINALIDHIRQLRIAQPIAQLHLAQAYNQSHRHLTAKAQEDVAMALLLGE